MNCGFGNLATLKAFVLPEAQAADTTYDARIQIIGQGVAAAIENYCNRSFAYLQNDQYIVAANRTAFFLPRYPLLNVSRIEMRDTPQGSWYSLGTVDDVAINIAEAGGIVEFGWAPAVYFSRIRFTFSGGYSIETREPTDEGYPSSDITGATSLTGAAVAIGSSTITVSSTANVLVGQSISGTGLAANSLVTAISDDGVTLTISTAGTANGSGLTLALTPLTVPALPLDLVQAWLLSSQRIFERARTLSLSGIKDVTRAGVLLLNVDEETQALVTPYKKYG